METNQNKKYLSASGLIILILSLLLVGIGGFLLYDYKVTQIEEKYTPEPIVVHDTIIRDSIQIQEKVKWKYITKHDTAIYIQHDTIIDTIYIQIPISHYQYRDTISTDSVGYSLGINYSGYKATLDTVWINHWYTPKTVVKTKRNGWGQFVGIGLGVGAGATVVNNVVYTGPEISLNIVYGCGYHW